MSGNNHFQKGICQWKSISFLHLFRLRKSWFFVFLKYLWMFSFLKLDFTINWFSRRICELWKHRLAILLVMHFRCFLLKIAIFSRFLTNYTIIETDAFILIFYYYLTFVNSRLGPVLWAANQLWVKHSEDICLKQLTTRYLEISLRHRKQWFPTMLFWRTAKFSVAKNICSQQSKAAIRRKMEILCGNGEEAKVASLGLFFCSHYSFLYIAKSP